MNRKFVINRIILKVVKRIFRRQNEKTKCEDNVIEEISN